MRKNKSPCQCEAKRSLPEGDHVTMSPIVRIFLFSAFCFLLSVFITGCAKKEIANINSTGKNIICFGDSITFGYGASPGYDFPARLAKLVKSPVINLGIDGDTTTEGLQRINNYVLERDPLLVIIEFAGNDFLKKIPMEATVKNVKEMIDMSLSKGAMVALVDISAGMFFRDYRIAFSKIAQEKGVIFIPSVLNGIITNPMLKSDFLHPNDNGYNMVALKIYKAISPYLKKNLILKQK